MEACTISEKGKAVYFLTPNWQHQPESIWWAIPAEESRYLVQRNTTSAGRYSTLVAACHCGWEWQAREGEMPGSVHHLHLELRIGQAACAKGTPGLSGCVSTELWGKASLLMWVPHECPHTQRNIKQQIQNNRTG